MIDHLVYGVSDLEDGIADLEQRLGVRAALGGKHPGAGTHNALIGLGEGSYLEIIAPDPDQSVHGNLPFGLVRGMQSQLVGWAVHTDEIDQRVARARASGHDPGDVEQMHRRRPDGEMMRWRLTRSAQPSASFVVPFLIDWGVTAHPSESAPEGVSLASLRAEHPEPSVVTARLRALEVSLPVSGGPDPALFATLHTPGGPVDIR